MMGIIGFLVGIVGFLNGQLIHLITETKWEHGIDYINKVGHLTKTILESPPLLDILVIIFRCLQRLFDLFSLREGSFLGTNDKICIEGQGLRKGSAGK